ncbi:sensor histidine kinase [Amycolatopsis minnesotensis]|uniref:histidine kinase n=1 Tax=Amycolatopsis minnesotensis TaxID=337894 RepID=A0ABP5BVE9_9PSEU
MVSAVPFSLMTLVTGLVAMVALPVLLGTAVLCVVWIGVFALPVELRLLGKVTDFTRALAARRLGGTIPGHGPRGRSLRELLGERGTWRDLRWVPVAMLCNTVAGIFGLTLALLPLVALFSIGFWWLFPADAPIKVIADIPIESWAGAAYAGIPMFVITVVLSLWLLPLLTRGSVVLNAKLLAPSEKDELAQRVETLRESRAGAVDAHGAELRRIERDLHDGTQARLVSIAMRLGLAERQLEKDPQAVAKLLADARAGAEDAMTELRTVLRTMYPPILADRGLDGALSAIAAQSTVPTEVTVGELGTLAAPVEAAAYFVITEALTNVAKHADASKVEVTLTRDVDVLLGQIVDDGAGGIDETKGTGIAGMRRRLAALDGTLWVTSPAGGPTKIVWECPCGS